MNDQVWTIQRNWQCRVGTQEEDKDNKKHNTMCVGHHPTQTNSHDVNTTCVLLQTGGKVDTRFIRFVRNMAAH